ncbi:hypothetical protein [Bradyrhizobium embrapense]|uniref:hypothetical protein n=1 Tax=Bradyrhizobium embrapense TaxID=630921 RepID=UPI00067CD3D7|nr:hypothetical protein [Bradyrhizobium embrapense]
MTSQSRAAIVRQLMTPRPSIAIAATTRHFDVHVWDRATRGYAADAAITRLSLEGGKVTVNRQPIVAPYFSGDTLTWSQKTDLGFSSGVIHFTRDRFAFGGQIHLGLHESVAVAHEVCGAVPPTVFMTQVARAPALGGPTDAGVAVTLGYELDPNGGLPISIIRFADEDVTTYCGMTINKDNLLQLDIPFMAQFAKPGFGISPLWPASGAIAFANDGLSFSGSLHKYDPATGEQTPQAFAWSGRAHAASQPATATAAVAPRLVAISNLSIAELVTLQPDPKLLQENAQDLLIQNTKWAMNPDWLGQFFGETRPQLPQSRIDTINLDLPFYQTKFAPAYLGWGFSHMTGPGAPSHTLSAAESDKLDLFLTKGLGDDPGYNRQNNALVIDAYIMTKPRIQDYINDGAEKWAKALFDQVTTDQQINLMMNRIITTHDMTLVNNTSTLLTCLQPSGELAQKYHTCFVLRPAIALANDVIFTDPDDIKTWLGDMIAQFIKIYIVTPTNPTQTRLRLQAAADELQTIMKDAGKAAELGAAATDFLISLHDLGFNNIAAAESKLAKYGPKVAGLFKMIAFGGGLLYAFKGFLDWNKLDDTGKANTIVTTIMLAGQAAESVPSMIKSVSEGFKNFSFRERGQLELTFSDRNVLTHAEFEMGKVDEEFVRKGAAEVRAAFRADGQIAGNATKWGKYFQNINKALKWLGVAVSAAFAVINTIEFNKVLSDPNSSVRDKAFSGIVAVAGLCETVCLTLNLAFSAACFGPAAAIFAVIGVVFMIVQMFEPQPKPESPVDKFMDDVVKPFLAAWTPPPADKSAQAAQAA